MRDLWFLKEGFEVEIFLFLATENPETTENLLDTDLHKIYTVKVWF